MATEYRIHLAGARAKLPPRRQPYWRQIEVRKYIGLRRGKADTWQARWGNSRTGERLYKSLGDVASMDYQAALNAAKEWWHQCDGGTPRTGTVESACKDYVANHCTEKGGRAAYYAGQMLKKNIYGTDFGSIPLDELHAADVDKWKNGLVVPGLREKNSANRILRTYKAAMNFAYRRGSAPTDKPWKVVKRFPVKDGQRTRILSKDERKGLIESAELQIAAFLTALYYTAARPNEMAAATVKDFDARSKTLRLVTHKGNGTERAREFPLDVNPHAFEFFRSLAKDKLPSAPLVSWTDGGHLQPQHWYWGITEARKRAELAGSVVAYTMRHTAISEWLSAGVDIGTVAKWSGTSVAMIDHYYHKYIPNSLTDRLAHLSAT